MCVGDGHRVGARAKSADAAVGVAGNRIVVSISPGVGVVRCAAFSVDLYRAVVLACTAVVVGCNLNGRIRKVVAECYRINCGTSMRICSI